LPLVCGFALDGLLERLAARGWSARRRATLGLAVVGLAAIDGLAFDWARFRGTFDLPAEQAASDAPFYQVQGDWRSMMNHVFAGHGAIGCDEEAPLERAAELDVGERPQVRLLDPAAGRLGAVRFSPNRLVVDLTLARP